MTVNFAPLLSCDYELICACVVPPTPLRVMLSMETHCFQKYILAKPSVENEFPKAGGDSGGADEANQRRPPQFRHGSQRGK